MRMLLVASQGPRLRSVIGGIFGACLGRCPGECLGKSAIVFRGRRCVVSFRVACFFVGPGGGDFGELSLWTHL